MKITFNFDKTEERHSTEGIRFELALRSTHLASAIIDIKHRVDELAQKYWGKAHNDEYDDEKVTDKTKLAQYEVLEHVLGIISTAELERDIDELIDHWEDTATLAYNVPNFDGKLDNLDNVEDKKIGFVPPTDYIC